jgi:hypothetical protein
LFQGRFADPFLTFVVHKKHLAKVVKEDKADFIHIIAKIIVKDNKTGIALLPWKNDIANLVLRRGHGSWSYCRDRGAGNNGILDLLRRRATGGQDYKNDKNEYPPIDTHSCLLHEGGEKGIGISDTNSIFHLIDLLTMIITHLLNTIIILAQTFLHTNPMAILASMAF